MINLPKRLYGKVKEPQYPKTFENEQSVKIHSTFFFKELLYNHSNQSCGFGGGIDTQKQNHGIMSPDFQQRCKRNLIGESF